MILSEFKSSMAPIVDRWPRAYTHNIMPLIYDEVKDLTVFDMDQISKNLLGSMRGAPMVPDWKKAVESLGFRAKPRPGAPIFTPAPAYVENFDYCVRDNVWADNDYIIIRGGKPMFIIKKASPNHPFVLEDAEVRQERLKEVRMYFNKGEYWKYLKERDIKPVPRPSLNTELKLVNYGDKAV